MSGKSNNYSNSSDRLTINARLDNCTTSQFEEYVKLRSAPMPYAGWLGNNQEFVLDPVRDKGYSAQNPICSTASDLKSNMVVGRVSLSHIVESGHSGRGWHDNPVQCHHSPQLKSCLECGAASKTHVLRLEFCDSHFPWTSHWRCIKCHLHHVISIYILTAVSGRHLYSFITITTFFRQLTTFPRLGRYVGFQILGATFAGLLVRASLKSTAWKQEDASSIQI